MTPLKRVVDLTNTDVEFSKVHFIFMDIIFT